jgi:hypothetical protein
MQVTITQSIAIDPAVPAPTCYTSLVPAAAWSPITNGLFLQSPLFCGAAPRELLCAHGEFDDAACRSKVMMVVVKSAKTPEGSSVVYRIDFLRLSRRLSAVPGKRTPPDTAPGFPTRRPPSLGRMPGGRLFFRPCNPYCGAVFCACWRKSCLSSQAEPCSAPGSGGFKVS